MNFRIVINIALAGATFLAAVWLLLHGPLFIHSLSAPDHGLLFAGAARYLLIAGLLGVTGFAAAVARAWMRGDIPLPPPGTIRPSAPYRGRIMTRYWYFLLLVLLGLGGALLLSRRTTATRDGAAALHGRAATIEYAIARSEFLRIPA